MAEATPIDTPAPPRSLPPFVRRFLDTEAAGGILLVVAAALALVAANSPLRHAYEGVWHTLVTVRFGSFGITEDLHHFINDALMALFFLVVGLEIKRELVVGDLRDRRVAALPALAAVGGMVVPAGIYALVAGGSPASAGWGVPMATDIAFALGVVALLGRRFPPALKLFLLSLAIVDDIGAIGVIALFYSGTLDIEALAIAVGAAVASAVLRRARVHWAPVHVALGLLCWLAALESGVHPTLAGVAFGLLTPARPMAPSDVVQRWTRDMSDEPSAHELQEMSAAAREAISPAERAMHLLHPFTSFVVVPLFAFANAGVRVEAGALSVPGAAAAAGGVAGGLLIGKVVGILGASALAIRLGLGTRPAGTTWVQLLAAATLAGIGFTVSLFIAELAFTDEALRDAAKLGVLAASLAAALAGIAITLVAHRRSLPRLHP